MNVKLWRVPCTISCSIYWPINQSMIRNSESYGVYFVIDNWYFLADLKEISGVGTHYMNIKFWRAPCTISCSIYWPINQSMIRNSESYGVYFVIDNWYFLADLKEISGVGTHYMNIKFWRAPCTISCSIYWPINQSMIRNSESYWIYLVIDNWYLFLQKAISLWRTMRVLLDVSTNFPDNPRIMIFM